MNIMTSCPSVGGGSSNKAATCGPTSPSGFPSPTVSQITEPVWFNPW